MKRGYDCPKCARTDYLATAEGEFPRARPFGTVDFSKRNLNPDAKNKSSFKADCSEP